MRFPRVMVPIVFAFIILFAYASFSFLNDARNTELNNLNEKAYLLSKMISSVSRFDAIHSQEKDFGYDPYKATLSQVIEAFNSKKLSMEFLLARELNNEIIFEAFSKNQPPRVRLNDERLAVPMRKALKGENGVIIELDYVGEKVFAAYRKVDNTPWGLVIKQPYNEYMWPYQKKSIIMAFILAIFIYVIYSSIKAYQSQKQRESEFANALDNSAIVCKVDTSGNITYVNDMFCKVSGYTRAELIDKPLSIHKHSDMSDEVYKDLWSTISAKETFKGLMRHKAKDGSTYYVKTVISPILDIKGNIKEYIAIYYDLTNLILSERKAKEQEELLIQQSRMAQIGELISMIAHQWKQPLARIGAISQNYQLKLELGGFKQNEDENKRNLLDSFSQIDLQISNLLTTMNDFRNFFNPKKLVSNVAMSSPVKKALQIIGSSLVADGIHIEEEYDDSMKTDMLENEVIQVVINILKNAHDNFIEKGIIDPMIKIKTTVSSSNLKLEISDNGKGIDEKMIDKIFEKYVSTKTEEKGGGLGLDMCKTIIESHNHGKIYAVNTELGANFIIELPITQ